MTLTAFWTYSRAYDNDGSYQPDLSQGNGRGDFNRDSVFVLTSLYELPIGRGKHFLGNVSRGMDMLVGGWQWNTTFTLGSGLPFSPSYANCNLDRDTGPCRPSLNGSFHMGSGSFNDQTTVGAVLHSRVALRFATARMWNRPAVPDLPDHCHANRAVSPRPGVAQFGNVRRNQFTGPGELMSDMSLFKNFTITERVKAQFQAEFFNVFNHPVYANPGNTCIDCAGAGIITGLEGDSQMRQMQLGFRVTF